MTERTRAWGAALILLVNKNESGKSYIFIRAYNMFQAKFHYTYYALNFVPRKYNQHDQYQQFWSYAILKKIVILLGFGEPYVSMPYVLRNLYNQTKLVSLLALLHCV